MEDAMKPIILIVLALGACSAAGIVELNESQVIVEGGGDNKAPLAAAEARKGCAEYGKRPVLIYQECTWLWMCNSARYVYDCVD